MACTGKGCVYQKENDDFLFLLKVNLTEQLNV